MTGVPVLRLNQQLVRQEVAFTDADGNYFFAGVASLDYIMPVSSGSGSQPNPNVGPQGNIFAPEFCQIDASTSPKRCNSNNSVVAENFVAVSKPAPVPVLLFQMPLPAGSWRLATEAGGYVITGGTVDADPSHTDLSSGFYALDFAGDCGTPILAPADGQVVLIQKIPTSNSATNSVTSFGNTVVLKHSGNVYTRYAHLHSISVKVGDQLKAGDQLGLMGSTGLSFGPHLHFQFYDGGFLPSNSQSEDVVVRQVQVENGSSSSSLIDFIAGAMYQSNNASATRTITCNK
jgi:murein DD-endopeptidase MepM/ murein hydrolase activator NlpD